MESPDNGTVENETRSNSGTGAPPAPSPAQEETQSSGQTYETPVEESSGFSVFELAKWLAMGFLADSVIKQAQNRS